MNATESGEFSYWDGDIHGINTKISPETYLEQEWYGHDHPERMYKVSFTLHADGSVITITLRQTDVHDDELKDMTDGWPDYYFNPIKQPADSLSNYPKFYA